MAKKYTLDELVGMVEREYFTAEEVSGVMGSDPQDIREVARQRPEALTFPVDVIGRRVKIPRIPFLRSRGVVI